MYMSTMRSIQASGNVQQAVNVSMSAMEQMSASKGDQTLKDMMSQTLGEVNASLGNGGQLQQWSSVNDVFWWLKDHSCLCFVFEAVFCASISCVKL